jgi:hypothetical protein
MEQGIEAASGRRGETTKRYSTTRVGRKIQVEI